MPFWEEKTLLEMDRDEWESLCDHCGKCCLVKLENDEDKNTEAQSIYYTNVACNLFNKKEGQCTDYLHRKERVPNCVRLTQGNLNEIVWLPLSCAYRRIMEGRGLADWHHLVSGDKNTVHETGHSVLGKVVLENEVVEEELEEHIVEWPLN